MNLIVYPAGMLKANCYIIFDEESRDGIMVDPGSEAGNILKLLMEKDINLKYIVLTHGHGDHIGGVVEIKEATKAEIMMSEKDDYLVHGGTQKMSPYFRNIKEFNTDISVKDGDTFKLNGFSFEIIETPGHTPGGICIKVNDSIFTGDTLFKDGVGRTDFEYGSHQTLVNSIQKKLFIYDDTTKVYPGHEEPTTIGYEKKYNPYI